MRLCKGSNSKIGHGDLVPVRLLPLAPKKVRPEIAPEEKTKIIKSDTRKKGFENNPKCLLVIKKNEKISRNEKCPATGKKYKQCCGFL